MKKKKFNVYGILVMLVLSLLCSFSLASCGGDDDDDNGGGGSNTYSVVFIAENSTRGTYKGDVVITINPNGTYAITNLFTKDGSPFLRSGKWRIMNDTEKEAINKRYGLEKNSDCMMFDDTYYVVKENDENQINFVIYDNNKILEFLISLVCIK